MIAYRYRVGPKYKIKDKKKFIFKNLLKRLAICASIAR
jgi:hypothetical protein